MPSAAQPLTLVLHELATNAAEDGALSCATGRLVLRWRRDEAGVLLDWCEQRGPPLTGAPAPAGFGTQLIEANVAPLDGTPAREWREGGLRCELRIGPGALADASGGRCYGRRRRAASRRCRRRCACPVRPGSPPADRTQRQTGSAPDGAASARGLHGRAAALHRAGRRPSDQFASMRISGFGTVQHAPSACRNTTHIRCASGP